MYGLCICLFFTLVYCASLSLCHVQLSAGHGHAYTVTVVLNLANLGAAAGWQIENRSRDPAWQQQTGICMVQDWVDMEGDVQGTPEGDGIYRRFIGNLALDDNVNISCDATLVKLFKAKADSSWTQVILCTDRSIYSSSACAARWA